MAGICPEYNLMAVKNPTNISDVQNPVKQRDQTNFDWMAFGWLMHVDHSGIAQYIGIPSSQYSSEQNLVIFGLQRRLY